MGTGIITEEPRLKCQVEISEEPRLKCQVEPRLSPRLKCQVAEREIDGLILDAEMKDKLAVKLPDSGYRRLLM